jgi:hypothetical protein
VTPDRPAGDDDGMIRNAVIHISNEQPLLADLYAVPTAADTSLVCTNIRMLDGKKPIFIEHAASVFVFPYLHIRFIEIMPGSSSDIPEEVEDEAPVTAVEPVEELEPEPDLELDEDFLRRIRDV